jgi:hypothetical protein
MSSKQVNCNRHSIIINLFLQSYNLKIIIQVLVLLIVAAFVVYSALGRPTEIVDSALKDNPPTGIIRVRFPSHSGLEEVEIFNRLLEPSSGGIKTEPNNQKNLQKGIGLESKGKGNIE